MLAKKQTQNYLVIELTDTQAKRCHVRLMEALLGHCDVADSLTNSGIAEPGHLIYVFSQ